MALELETDFKGFKANYYKISEWLVDVYNDSTSLTVLLYKDQNTRIKTPSDYLKMESYRLPIVDFNGRTDLYNTLKKLSDFSNAKDV